MGARLSVENKKQASSKTGTKKHHAKSFMKMSSSTKGSNTTTGSSSIITAFSNNKKNESAGNGDSNITAATTPVSSQYSNNIIFNGRKFHNEMSSTYWLPCDNEELDRIIAQHFALKALFGSNIPEKAFQEPIELKKDAKILDLGCGPGTWIMDMATEFPLNHFVGLDLSDVFPNKIRPPNTEFQVANILDGLKFPDNTFQMVHMRSITLAFKATEWGAVCKEVNRVLVPGGLVLSREPGLFEVGNDFVLRINDIYVQRMRELSREPHITDKMKGILENTGFEVLECDKKQIFLGQQDRLSKDFMWDLKSLFKSAEALLLRPLNLTSEEYPAFLNRLEVECQNTPQAQWCMCSTLARKPLA